MSSGSAFTERRVAKTRRVRSSSSSSSAAQTRKRRPSAKKTVQMVKDYIPRDQESDIPISSYQPLSLPQTEPGNHNQETHYKVTQSETDDTFIATVYRHKNGYSEITLGGSGLTTNSCVNIIIHNVYINNKQYIVEAIFNVDYNERCNIDKNLKSALILARVAISFAFTYFRIDKFILKDNSRFHCKTSHDDYEFSLAGRDLLKYGKTWYQRHLNAHIFHPETLENIQQYLRFVETKPSWDVFSQTKDPERLKPIWKKSTSYKELVLTLLDTVRRIYPDTAVTEQTNKNCDLLYPWFKNVTLDYLHDLAFVDNFILRDGFQFVEGLKVEFIPENEVGLIQGGGRRGNGYDGWNRGGFWFTERIR
jgi:hypothetical protein